MVFWTSDTGIDGENPVELDELDLILIDPLPSYVWYQDMVDFADGISDRAAGRAPEPLAAGQGCVPALQERALRTPPRADLGLAAMRDARARVRAVEWLVDQGLIDDGAAQAVQARPPRTRPAMTPFAGGARRPGGGGSVAPLQPRERRTSKKIDASLHR